MTLVPPVPPSPPGPPEFDCDGTCELDEECLEPLKTIYQDAMQVYGQALLEANNAALTDYLNTLQGCLNPQCTQAALEAYQAACGAAATIFAGQKAQLDDIFKRQAQEQCCTCQGED